jgi:hypothetical protein
MQMRQLIQAHRTEGETMSSFDHEKNRQGRSVFGPLFLIAIGAYFLLYNTGRIPELNWAAALRLWPLLLVFIGLNIIVQQAPRPYGTLLSSLVGLTAIAIFGYVLFTGPENLIFTRLGISPTVEYRFEEVTFQNDNVQQLDVELEISAQGANIYPLEDSNNLLAGTVSVLGELDFEQVVNGERADLELRDNQGTLWFTNPASWLDNNADAAWEIGLARDLLLALHVKSGAGPLVLDLTGLTLDDLTVSSGAGPITMLMPGGDYSTEVDMGAGSVDITLPAEGEPFLNIGGGAGSIDLFLPRGMQAQIDVDSGAGKIEMDSRFVCVRGCNDGRDSLWETQDYTPNGANSVTIQVDMGAGGLTVSQPQGR